MSPNCSHKRMIKMPSGVVKCADCNAIDSRFYGSWWPSVFTWAKPMKGYFERLLKESCESPYL